MKNNSVQYENPVALRSRTYITSALIKLMEIKKYDEITMTQIAIKAGVSRRTIYRNFLDKNAILNYYIKELTKEYFDFFYDDENKGLNNAQISFMFIQKHLPFFKLAYKNNLLINIIDILENVLKRIVFETNKDKFSRLDDKYLDYYVAFNSGGCWRLLNKWLENDAEQTPKEMSEIYKILVKDINTRLS